MCLILPEPILSSSHAEAKAGYVTATLATLTLTLTLVTLRAGKNEVQRFQQRDSSRRTSEHACVAMFVWLDNDS